VFVIISSHFSKLFGDQTKVLELFDWKLRLAVLASFKHWDLHYLIYGKDPTRMA